MIGGYQTALLGVIASKRSAADLGTPVSLLHFDGTAGSSVYVDEYGASWSGFSASVPTLSTTQSKFGGSSLRLPGGNIYCQIRSGVDEVNLLGNGSPTDFCLEFWLYMDVVSGTYGIAANTNAASPADWNLEVENGQVRIRLGGTNNTIAALGGTVISGIWHHIAFTREGSTIRVFVDGVQATSGTYSHNSNDNGALGYGCSSNGGNAMAGYIDEARAQIGSAKYTTNFTPPAAPFTS